MAAAVPPATPDKDATKKGPAGPADIGPKPETNPAVLSALEMPRKKPADYVQSILLLIDLGRPELAKPILADLAKLELTDAQRQELVDQFGAGSMLKLSHSKELAPEGATFADACMAVASAITNNPQRIATLIGQLSDPSPETRLLAQHDLAATGPKAATATLETFAKEPDRNRRAALAAGIAAMHPFVDGMLLAMLDTHDPVLRADVADLLRQLQVPQAQPLVTASDAAAEHEISTALSSYERGTPVFLTDQDNQVELWQWNDATKQLSSARVPAAEARIVWMSKLAAHADATPATKPGLSAASPRARLGSRIVETDASQLAGESQVYFPGRPAVSQRRSHRIAEKQSFARSDLGDQSNGRAT